MLTCISILRGINVSGHKMIKMEALKKMCAALDFSNIKTYIQSGNLVFQTKETNLKKLNKTIETAISSAFGFDVPVITLTKNELENLIKLNPFAKDKSKNISFLHISFLSAPPAKERIEKLLQTDFSDGEYRLVNKAIYLYCPAGYGNTKFTNGFLENKLKVTATTRNWKTANELLKMALEMNE